MAIDLWKKILLSLVRCPRITDKRAPEMRAVDGQLSTHYLSHADFSAIRTRAPRINNQARKLQKRCRSTY
jgi:hypothetical protein